MATDQARQERLTTAAAFCLFDKKLASSGNSSLVWGVLNLLIGGLLVAGNDLWGWPSLLLGLGLVVAGLYEKKVRDPKVVIVSAATLAVLALWNFTLVALAAMGRMHVLDGGRTLFWAIAQLVGAYGTWKTYAAYKILREKADELTVNEVRGYIDELAKAKPAQSLDLVEFEANAGFREGTKKYRLKPLADMYTVARYKSQLSSLKLEEVTFVPRNEVSIAPEGEKFMSKKIKATVRLGALTISKVSITPEMVARIDPTVRAMAIATS
jgi:hypothetical protein